MSEFLLLLFNAALINNLALSHLLGLDLQLAASRRMQVAWFTGTVTLICISVSMPLARLLDVWLLAPLQLSHINLLIYVITSVCILGVIQQLASRVLPLMVEKIRALLPLLLINSTLPGVMLLQQTSDAGLFKLTLLAVANGIGFLLLLLIITCLRERIDDDQVHPAFRGIPVVLVGLGIFSMGLMGLIGIE